MGLKSIFSNIIYFSRCAKNVLESHFGKENSKIQWYTVQFSLLLSRYYGVSNNRPGRLFFFNFFAVPGRSYSSWSIINVQESHRPTPCLKIPFFILFYFFFFSGGLIFLLIFFNVLMMYKNIFFYTFRNFLEFVIITIVSKSRFSHTLVFYSGLFSYMFETFNCSDFCRNAKIRRKLENRPVKLDFSKGGLLFQLVYY